MLNLFYRTRRRLAALLGALALIVLAALSASTAYADDDPSLGQKLGANQPIARDKHVLEAGHVDMGPKYDKNTWRFLIHDDAARADASATSVWRYPEQTVLRVLDAARQSVPSDKAYSFLGVDPGTPVWVIPQTQNPDVVWTGWNTQDPTVMSKVDRGVTLSLTGVQGPGELTVYLQSGSFGDPQVLWDSRKDKAQPVWVDVNTHTHANWVFTKPGVYLVRMQASADLKDGSKATDTQLIRFAVGTDTSVDDAFAAAWKGEDAPDPVATGQGATTDQTTRTAADDPDDQSIVVPILIGVIVVVAVALIVGFVIAIVRSNRTRRRILAARSASAAATPEAPGPQTAGEGER